MLSYIIGGALGSQIIFWAMYLVICFSLWEMVDVNWVVFRIFIAVGAFVGFVLSGAVDG